MKEAKILLCSTGKKNYSVVYSLAHHFSDVYTHVKMHSHNINKQNSTAKTTNQPALLIWLDQWVWTNSSHQELGAQQRQANMLQHLKNTEGDETNIKVEIISATSTSIQIIPCLKNWHT